MLVSVSRAKTRAAALPFGSKNKEYNATQTKQMLITKSIEVFEHKR